MLYGVYNTNPLLRKYRVWISFSLGGNSNLCGKDKINNIVFHHTASYVHTEKHFNSSYTVPDPTLFTYKLLHSI